jgi:hypothetical protein
MKRLLLVVASFSVWVHGAAAEPVAVPGTTVTLEPPPGFTSATNFAGFEHAASGSSLMVTELPKEAYDRIAAAFATREEAARQFVTQGVVVTDRATVEADGKDVVVLTGTQEVLGVKADKYIALARGDKTVLLTFNGIGGQLSAADARAAIGSLRLGAEPSLEEKLANLTFTVEIVPPFRIVDVLAGSSMMLSTGDGATGGSRPIVVIASSLGGADSGDLAMLSERMLRDTRGYADAVIASAAPAPFAGALGFRLEADSGPNHVVHYLLVLPSGRYIRMIARGETAALQPLLESIEALARSVRVREGALP